MLGSLLLKLQVFKPATFLKKDSNTGVSCGYCTSFKANILKNICERLLLDYFNGSLIHRPKGLMYVLYDNVRLEGPSQRSNFLFLRGDLSS